MKKFLFSLVIATILLWLPKVTIAQCSPGEHMCLVTILCDDMVGDGWNGASLEVWQGTTLRGNVTLTSGYSGDVEVPVCTGDTVRFVWSSGPLDYEISFSIINGDGTVVLADVMAGDLSDGRTD